MNMMKSFSVALLCSLSLSQLNAAETQAGALSAQWENAIASKSSEAEKLAIAKQLLAYWDARLNSTYQRGLKQYPKSASTYRNAQRKWLEYRDCAMLIAGYLGDTSQSEKKMLTKGSPIKESALTAFMAMLTMERVYGLLEIEEQRSTYSERDVEDNFRSPLSEGEPKGVQEDQFSNVWAMAADEVYTTAEINMLAGLDVQAAKSKAVMFTNMLSLVIQTAQQESDKDLSECADTLLRLFEECRKLNVAAIDAEFVRGMTGTIQVSIDLGIHARAYYRYTAMLMILLKRDACVFSDGQAPVYEDSDD